MLEEIKYLIDTQINPQLAAHRGACEIVSLTDNVLSIRLTGGCVGCPGRKATTLKGIRPFIMGLVPVTDVVLVD